MEIAFHIIIFVLFIGLCFCVGYVFSSCIRIDKKLKQINDAQLRLINLLERENNHCKDVLNHCKTVIDDNKTLLFHMYKASTLTNNYLLFIKQNMIRRKTPIIDE